MKKAKKRLALAMAVLLMLEGIGDLSIPQVWAAVQEETVSAEKTEEVKETEEEIPEEDGKKEEETPDGDSTGELEEEKKKEEETPEKGEENKSETAVETMPMQTALPVTVSENDRGEFKILDELALTVRNCEGWSAQNKSLQMTQEGTQYDLSANPFYDVNKLSFYLNFQVKKDDSDRKLKEGDTLTIVLPEVLSFAASASLTGHILYGEHVIANYEFSGKNLTFTFTDVVNSDNGWTGIAGGLELELDVDSEKLKNADTKEFGLHVLGEDEAFMSVKFPEVPNEISGISKSGVVNSDNTITWTITVGTADSSKGVSLNGVKLKEVFDENQTFVSAQANGQSIPLENGALSLAGLNLNAPAAVTVITAPEKEAIEKEKKVENQVTMEPLNAAVEIDPEHADAKAEVQLKAKAELEKSGEQIDSHTIRWTIRVNHKNPVTVYKGMVIDKLPEGLTYKENTFSCSAGNTYSIVKGAPTEWKADTLYIEKEGTKDNLYFCLPETTSAAYTLTFETEVADSYTKDTTKVENKVSVKAQFPHWNHGIEYSEYPEYGIPGAEVTFAAAKINKSVKADKTTVSGQLTWTLEPSTRMTDYETAEMTDVIQKNQEYVTGSLQIFHKNGQTDQLKALEKAGIFSCSYDEENAELKLVFTKSKAVDTSGFSNDLRDYQIVYKTTALDYLYTNSKRSEYENTAKLTIEAGNTAVTAMGSAQTQLESKWIKKSTKFEYDTKGNPYFHYTITVNENNVKDLTNVTVTDDTTNAIRFFGQSEKISSDWCICKEKTAITYADGSEAMVTEQNYDAAGKVFTYTFAQLTQKVTIDLYVTYVGEKKELTQENGLYKNEKLYSCNTAGICSDQIYLGENSVPLTATDDNRGQLFDNTLVQKSNGTLKTNSGETKICWRVLINPNSGQMGSITISDEIEKTQKYVEDSVKLYPASFTEGSAVIGTDRSKTIEFQSEFDVTEEKRTMELTVNADSRPLILEYETAVVESGISEVKNHVSVAEGTAAEYGSDTGVARLSGQEWGMLQSVGNIRIRKFDTSIGARLPLQGAQITLYSDAAATKKADVGVTKADGVVRFIGVEVNENPQKYYYKETKAPAGYTADDTIYEVEVYRGKTQEIELGNERETLESQEQTAAVSFTKVFSYKNAEGNPEIISGKTAQFQLVFYPYGKDCLSDPKVVSLQETAEGSYRYNKNSGTCVIKNAADGTVTISNLPWGYYGIQEIASAEGFAADPQEKYFEITSENGKMTVHYGFLKTIVNSGTVLHVVKYAGNTEKIIPDIQFSILDEAGNVVKDPLDEEKSYEWTTTDRIETFYHLPAGTYRLHEAFQKEEQDLIFKVETDGRITIAGTEQENHTIVLRDTSADVKLTKYSTWNSELEKVADNESEYERLVGVKFELNGKLRSGKTKLEAVTDENGEITFSHYLIDGETYTLTEETPIGYEPLEEPIEFVYHAATGAVLTNDSDGHAVGCGTELNIRNDSKQNSALQFVVRDSRTKRGIPGVEFELESEVGDMTDLVSAHEGDFCVYEAPGEEKTHVMEAGEVFAANLTTGTYTLRQTAVPSGYRMPKNPLTFSFTVSDEEQNEFLKVDEDAFKEGKYGLEYSGDFYIEVVPVVYQGEEEETKKAAVQNVELQTVGVLPKTSREECGSYWLAGAFFVLLGVEFYLGDRKKKHLN